MIRRILPWPILSGFLLLMWLLMNQTVAPGHVLLGAVLAVVLPLVTSSLRPHRSRVRKPWLFVRLFFLALADSLRSNLNVARIILGSREQRSRSGFVKIPLELHDPHGLALLAIILTAVPGTVWCELSEDKDMLTIHVLDLTDPTTTAEAIKSRYESLLLEIFQ